ncbi:MAG: TlpA family protein disulfide reductase [Candidatus Cloacimonetes bacterium]|nr:TlpA family protein disulfide reductase [Candidatus Cloacimonadota bacterium]
MSKKTLFLLIVVTTFVAILFSSPAPSFTIETMQGDVVRSEDLLAKGPIYLDFWSTSCEPCLRKLPHVSSWVSKYPEMSFFAISTDSPRQRDGVVRHVRSSRYQFTTGIDSSRNLQRLFNVSLIPRTIIINQAGEIVYDNQGYNPGDEVELENFIISVIREEGH